MREPDSGALAAAQARLDVDRYDENGVDLSLIRMNMRLTPTERARRGERARRALLRVMEIGRALRRQPA